MIQRVYEQACQSKAKAVYIATDHNEVFERVKTFTSNVLMTKDSHQSGTERLAEVVDLLTLETDTIIVNVQGDEPLLAPQNIDQVARLLADSSAPMATLSVDIESAEEVFNPNVVKVVQDANKNALYFSRAPIPFQRSSMLDNDAQDIPLENFQRHVGIYAYRAGFIKEYLQLPVSGLEVQESLEQLRVLFHGKQIKIEKACEAVHAGVDTPEDLANVIAYLNEQN